MAPGPGRMAAQGLALELRCSIPGYFLGLACLPPDLSSFTYEGEEGWPVRMPAPTPALGTCCPGFPLPPTQSHPSLSWRFFSSSNTCVPTQFPSTLQGQGHKATSDHGVRKVLHVQIPITMRIVPFVFRCRTVPSTHLFQHCPHHRGNGARKRTLMSTTTYPSLPQRTQHSSRTEPGKAQRTAHSRDKPKPQFCVLASLRILCLG